MLKQTILAPKPLRTFFILLLAGCFRASTGAETVPELPRPPGETMAHACAGCHGSFGRSRGEIPALAGMTEARFVETMRAFKSGKRVSSIMNRIAKGYRDGDFLAMARFFGDFEGRNP
jgi:cytochrome subunit of sulfide dehydrogenase